MPKITLYHSNYPNDQYWTACLRDEVVGLILLFVCLLPLMLWRRKGWVCCNIPTILSNAVHLPSETRDPCTRIRGNCVDCRLCRSLMGSVLWPKIATSHVPSPLLWIQWQWLLREANSKLATLEVIVSVAQRGSTLASRKAWDNLLKTMLIRHLLVLLIRGKSILIIPKQCWYYRSEIFCWDIALHCTLKHLKPALVVIQVQLVEW